MFYRKLVIPLRRDNDRCIKVTPRETVEEATFSNVQLCHIAQTSYEQMNAFNLSV